MNALGCQFVEQELRSNFSKGVRLRVWFVPITFSGLRKITAMWGFFLCSRVTVSIIAMAVGADRVMLVATGSK